MEAYTIIDQEEFLRKKSREVNLKKENYQEDIQILEKYCKENDVFAMAAVQVGILKRIIYLKNTDLSLIDDDTRDEHRILINPIILRRTGLTQYWEACASCLDNTGLVLRPYQIEVEYHDEYGMKRKDMFTGFGATVLSHEYDHLDGILHMDIALEVRQMDKEERKKFREKHGYEIFFEKGDYQELLKERRNELK